jgi:hypothetical protein
MMLRAYKGGVGLEQETQPEDKLACLNSLERKLVWLST